MYHRRILSLTALVFSLALPCLAQDPPPPPPDPWSGGGELSYVSTSGNTDTSAIGFAAEALYTQPIWSAEFRASFIQNEAEGDVTAERTTALAGYKRRINDDLDWYSRASYLRNEFAGIDSNLSAELGAAYKVLKGPRHLFDVGAGLGYTWEERIDAPERNFANATANSKYVFKFSETADFTDDASVLLNVEDTDDWRLANTAAITARLTTMFSLKFSNTITYLNEPVPGFEETDTITTAAIVAKF